MSYKMLIVAAAVLASASVANAHTAKNSVTPSNSGTPSDYNQGVERDVHGAPHGSISNPSPHGYVKQGNGDFEAYAMSGTDSRQHIYTGGGSEGYERLLNSH